MPLNGHNFDPYFTYAKRNNYWHSRTLLGVTVESVTCECGYRPRHDTIDPKRAYKAHVRKYHPTKYWTEMRQPLVIQEEDDLADVDDLLAGLRS